MRRNLIKYRLLTGIIVSMFLGMLTLLPQLVQETEGSFTDAFINLCRVLTFSISCWLANQYILQAPHFPQGLKGQLLRLAASFLFAFILSCIMAYIFRHFLHVQDIQTIRQLYWRRSATGIAVFRGIFVNSFLYFISYMLHLNYQNQQAQIENERLKHENLEARLYVLHQQLNPHFLFNSLGILNTLTADAAVRKYIVQLSHVYRYLLASHEGYLSTLRREMDFINAYLYIIKERFEDAITLKVEANEDDLDKKLPPAALQLLIENAVKHNVVSTLEPLTVAVYTTGNYVVVTNNFNPKMAGSVETNGIGLHNIAERYNLLNGGDIVIERTTDLFTVKLPLL
jgi:two-component system, LytTR family, sensor kinase